MPSAERSQEITQSKDPRSPYSYDKIMAFFNKRADPMDTSVATRSNKVTVAFTNTANFNDTINNLSKDEYLETAGEDLSAIFMPFETNVNPQGSGLPGFLKGAEIASPTQSESLTLPNLLPFRWEPHRKDHVFDRWNSPSGDGINGLPTADKIYADHNRYRDIAKIRGIGLRLPLMGVGWGYTLHGAQAMPSGTSQEIQGYGPNHKARVFKGGHTKGWQVDPSEYIAAPIDFRYDPLRHVWTCGGPGLPPGSGIYKVLTLVNNESPGLAAWDYMRFPPIEPI